MTPRQPSESVSGEPAFLPQPTPGEDGGSGKRPVPSTQPQPAPTAASADPAPPAAASATRPQASPASLTSGELDRLRRGVHHDPHSVLGAHRLPDGDIAVRVLRPFAESVRVEAEGLRAELIPQAGGLFTAALPLTCIPDHRLVVTYDGTEHTVEDPYRFLPTLGELDLHLIGEGRHERLWEALGSHVTTVGTVTGTRFTVWAPNALGVRVAGDFNNWDGTSHPMRSLGSSGVWELFVPEVGAGTLYKYEVARRDGSLTMKADPMARATEVPPATASVVTVSEYVWSDQSWIRTRSERSAHEAPFSVYEVHLPSWRPGLDYRALAEELPRYVKDLGFTHVELMPVAEHPFGGSWGYQVTSYYAPTSRLGTPDDFKFLVDALHRAGVGVIMDWVPAHFPKDEWALARFDGTTLYEHPDPATAEHPDWGTLVFDYGRNEVRNFLVANAVYWCEEFHIDGLRVDAVASMLYLDYSREYGQWTPNRHGGRENLDAVAFLQEMNATVYRRCPGVVTVAEESTAWDGVTRATHHTGPGGFGGLGFGLKWNMGWMHDSLEYMSKEPVHRKYHHHGMTFSMVYAYSENYCLPISHDEVVHGKGSLVSKMPGDWWQQRASTRAYLGFMWAHPGKQLLFMGQEFAQGAEWSHDRGPDWWLLDPAYPAEPDHRGVRDLVRDLNHVYADTPALWSLDASPDGFSWIDGEAAEDNVLSFVRYDDQGTPLVCVSNFSPVVREHYRVGVPDTAGEAWREVLNTDALSYGGSGVVAPESVKAEAVAWNGRRGSIQLALPPLATVWLKPV
ncbi:1,4-alpha-glucan branching protein GlgB [Wenjunlia tyrosinilytica]|uniref:1,4-alpha-glucan branching enzyme GlgB n=1 Tax=Wenjunlia tyrosinilytica TaxID=1544741 RepID=A0A917ZUI4_9ACTN|nr:1,4-alpha-glucan branching enzyme GlgB 1 [Wenjunlia tyrosinilytica]